MRILVSACLLGIPCRYDGRPATNGRVFALGERHELVPICPEQMAGQPAPRQPAEIRGDRVLSKDGRDVTALFLKGAELAVRMARRLGCTYAVFKQNSPSCGCGRVYDGTFSGVKIAGDGVATKALKENGVTVIGDEDVDELAP